MLSKTKTGSLTSSKTLFNETNYAYQAKTYKYYFVWAGTLNINLTIRTNDRYDGYTIKLDGQTIKSQSASTWDITFTVNESVTVAWNGEHELEVYYSYSVWYGVQYQYVTGTINFTLTIPGINGYLIPDKVVNIWVLGFPLSYWKSAAWFHGGIMMAKSSTATTGSVTLGNAVGYIKVYFNGEYIKIPYYGN